MTARLVIAGTQSGVGKTTLTAGLIAALCRRGLTVQPFKVGPDYIDPTYHTLAAGRPCRNLDTWMTPPETARSLFTRAVRGVDVAVIEGVMGLYDGAGYDDETGSTAEVAKLLEAPVVVVLDASKMARSAAAMALGYQHFDVQTPLAGFIINRVANDGHGRGVAAALEKATGCPVLGWLPRHESLQIPERHLGLIPVHEPGRWQEFIQAASDLVEQRLNIDQLLRIARAPANMATCDEPELIHALNRPVIAVAHDEAFSFTYEDNLDLLRAAGADIIFFSPLNDDALPARTAGIILSGGFPEVYAKRLSANDAMKMALRAAHRRSLPIYAECGGLMYLTQSIRDANGDRHPMAGLLGGECVMGGRLTLGYRLARSASGSWFMSEGDSVRGHEFHCSEWIDRPANLTPAYFLSPRTGGEARPEGARLGCLWASYVHVHFGAKPELAARFVQACDGAYSHRE